MVPLTAIFPVIAYYNIFFICFLQATCIVLPQKVNPLTCPILRHALLLKQKLFYKLTTPPSKPLAYPSQTTNILEAVPFPLLNQHPITLLLRSLLLPGLGEQKWLPRFLGSAVRNQGLAKKTIQAGKTFTKYSDYAQLLRSYRAEQPKSLISFKFPGLVSIFSITYPKLPRRDSTTFQ